MKFKPVKKSSLSGFQIPKYATLLDKEKPLSQIIREAEELERKQGLRVKILKSKPKKFIPCQECELWEMVRIEESNVYGKCLRKGHCIH